MRLQFSNHTLDTERREVWRGTDLVALEPQVFDLLVHLVEHRERVVSKDELLSSVWAGRAVSESTLNSRINAVRTAIGDTGSEQNLLRTLPRKGFRFVGSVVESEAPKDNSASKLHNGASIAVLPFDNFSDDPERDYFADGMVAEIINGLSRIKWLFVISRQSTARYKGRSADVKAVGRELGVRYLLEGSVQRSGDHVRMSGQLVETESAVCVWADRYEGRLGDIFTLQDQMTMSVIGAIEPTLRKVELARSKRKRPENLDAYDFYLRALPYASAAMPEHADQALLLLEQALRLEPDYAAVHGFMAWCHEQRYLRGGLDPQTREAARKHAYVAISAGNDDANALAMGGFVIAVMERNYTTALDAIDRALELSPSSGLAFGFSSIVRAWMGDSVSAISHGTRGISLCPHDPLIYLPYVGLAYAHFFAQQWDQAAHAANKASHANPQFSVPHYLHAAALFMLGQIDKAKEEAAYVLALQPGFTVGGLVAGKITSPERMAALSDALRLVGLPD